jgi:hypothetical protein
MIFIGIAIVAVIVAGFIARRPRAGPNWVSLLYLFAVGCLIYGLYRVIF